MRGAMEDTQRQLVPESAGPRTWISSLIGQRGHDNPNIADRYEPDADSDHWSQTTTHSMTRTPFQSHSTRQHDSEDAVERGYQTSARSSSATTGAESDSESSDQRTLRVDHEIRDSNETTKPPIETSRWTQRLLSAKKFWSLEIASFMFAILAFTTIVLLLATWKDKEQPDWPSWLNINTLLSILKTILKTTLLFPVVEGIGELKWIRLASPHSVRDLERWDAASRSPWGSLRLILRRPGSLLASLGAGGIILSIAIDPFAQQVLEFYSCQQPLEGIFASIPRTNNYTLGSVLEGGFYPTSTEKRMTLALYKGVLDPPPNPSSAISVSCPSGNCTFGEPGGALTYSSLALCPSVYDISDSIIGSENWTTWNYSLPSGHRIIGGMEYLNEVVATRQQHWRRVGFELLMVSFDCTDPKAPTKDSCSPGATAFNVTFAPYINTYGNISFANAVFRERLLSSTLLIHNGPLGYYSLAGDYPSAMDTDCSTSLSPQRRKTQLAAILEDGKHTSLHNSAMADTGIGTTYYDPACVYEVDEKKWAPLIRAFNTFFGFESSNPMTLKQGRLPGDAYNAVGDEWLRTLWRNGTANLTTVAGFADSLSWTVTAAMREGGDPSNSQLVLGKAYKTRTCVGVNWPWLAYPALVLVMTLVFIVLTIYRSRRFTGPGGKQSGRRKWKSSTLLLLWCGIPDSTRDRAQGVGDIAEMGRYSDTVTVRLERDEKPPIPGKRESPYISLSGS